MSKTKIYLLIVSFIGIMLLASCEKKELTYTGENTIYLSIEKDNVLTTGENGKIGIKLTAVHKAIENHDFEFKIKALEGANPNLVYVKGDKIRLKEGEREVVFYIEAKEGEKSDIDLLQYELTIENFPHKSMKLDKPLRFNLLNVKVPELTQAQKGLLENYKAKGMDLSPYIGKLRVKVSVKIPADGSIEGFLKPDEKKYEGFSIVTLSEKSTNDKPILKMIYNPMGLNEFFYFAMRKHTIENKENWYSEYTGPAIKGIMELIKWNDKSVESFTSSLDDMIVGAKSSDKSNLMIIGKGEDAYGDSIDVVPFKFIYSAWDRQKKLIDSGNKQAKEYHEQGGSAYPPRYLNNTGVKTDEYGNGIFIESKGTLNFDAKKMKFDFVTSVTDGGDYIVVNVEYSL